MPAMSSDCVTECLHSLWQPRRRKPCCILSSRLMVWSRICTADWWIVKWRWMISFDNTLVKRWTILLPPFSLSQMSRIEHFCDFCDFRVTFLGLPVGKKSWRTYPSNAYLWSHRFRMPLSKRPSQAMLSTVIWQWGCGCSFSCSSVSWCFCKFIYIDMVGFILRPSFYGCVNAV